MRINPKMRSFLFLKMETAFGFTKVGIILNRGGGHSMDGVVAIDFEGWQIKWVAGCRLSFF